MIKTITYQLFLLDGQIQQPCQTAPGTCDESCERTCTGACRASVGVSSNAKCPLSPRR